MCRQFRFDNKSQSCFSRKTTKGRRPKTCDGSYKQHGNLAIFITRTTTSTSADIQEELVHMVRMIEDCNIWSLAVFFVVHSERLLLLDLGAQTTV